MKVGDVIKHKWTKGTGIVVGRMDPKRMPQPKTWLAVFSSVRATPIMVHEDSCEVISESRR